MGRFTTLAVAVAFIVAHSVSTAAISSKYTWLLKGMKVAAQKASVPDLVLYSVSLEAPADENEGNISQNKNIRIINLGPVINFKGVDYAPTISADGKTLYYVSNKKGSKLKPDKDASHDFWAAKKNNDLDTVFFQPFNIDTTKELGNLGVNTQLNEGAASIAADKQTLVFTGCQRPDGLGDCDLYIVEIDGDKWGKPKNLGRKVNSEEWDSQPTISPDKSRIYFSSNRPGPNGSDNFDLWYTDFDFDTQEWKQAVNAGPTINTDGRERSPFIAADNQTSSSHPTDTSRTSAIRISTSPVPMVKHGPSPKIWAHQSIPPSAKSLSRSPLPAACSTSLLPVPISAAIKAISISLWHSFHPSFAQPSSKVS